MINAKRFNRYSVVARHCSAVEIIVGMLLPAVTGATTATTTFPVTVTIAALCNLNVSPLAFGTYNGAILAATTNVVVTCTNTTPYNVGIDAGAASGATVTNRQMSLAGNRVRYSLSTDANHSVNWGQTIGTDTQAGTGTGNGNSTTFTVYGQVAAAQFVTPGNYTDTVIVTVTY